MPDYRAGDELRARRAFASASQALRAEALSRVQIDADPKRVEVELDQAVVAALDRWRAQAEARLNGAPVTRSAAIRFALTSLLGETEADREKLRYLARRSKPRRPGGGKQ